MANGNNTKGDIMAHAQICIICNGKGKIQEPEKKYRTKCHGCDGKGWVEVCDTYPPLLPVYPQPISPSVLQYPWLPPYEITCAESSGDTITFPEGKPYWCIYPTQVTY